MEEWSAERLSDRMQIAEVLYRYCAAIDRIMPHALLDSVFHADAMVDKTGTPVSVGEFIAEVAGRHPGVPRASHMITNHLIDFLDDDSAWVESWCLALEGDLPRTDANGLVDRIYRVRYGDRFERRGQGPWRIASRTFVLDHVLGVAVDAALVPDSPLRHTGRRDANDPIVLMRLANGLSPI